jgi:Fe-S-cluster-containing hydrogenase component 2
MISQSHALKALTPQETLSIVRGSCVRHRFSRSNCNACFDVCPTHSLEWKSDGLHWDKTRCQSCLLCSAVCPSGALRANEVSLVSLLHAVKDLEHPVIACHVAPKAQGHARLPCLGLLADPELLLSMLLALGCDISLNLLDCAACQNHAVIIPLQKTVSQVNRLSDRSCAVELVFDADKINFKERNCSRREFFSLFRKRSTQVGVCVVDRLKADDQQEAYGTKRLPERRQLLLQVLDILSTSQEIDKENLFPQRVTTDNCRHCTGCVGICPTGALKSPGTSGAKPVFLAEKCVDCKLCEAFCSVSAIKVISALA